jgi:hypothetical protein
VGRLERELENPTVGLLDRLAKALSAHLSELFVEPRGGNQTRQRIEAPSRLSRMEQPDKFTILSRTMSAAGERRHMSTEQVGRF